MQMGYIPGVQAPQRLALSTLPQPPGPGFVWGCQKKGDGTGGVPTAPTAASSHAPHTQQLTLILFILFFPSMGQWSPVHSNRTQVSSSSQQSWGLPWAPGQHSPLLHPGALGCLPTHPREVTGQPEPQVGMVPCVLLLASQLLFTRNKPEGKKE